MTYCWYFSYLRGPRWSCWLEWDYAHPSAGLPRAIAKICARALSSCVLGKNLVPQKLTLQGPLALALGLSGRRSLNRPMKCYRNIGPSPCFTSNSREAWPTGRNALSGRRSLANRKKCPVRRPCHPTHTNSSSITIKWVSFLVERTQMKLLTWMGLRTSISRAASGDSEDLCEGTQ